MNLLLWVEIIAQARGNTREVIGYNGQRRFGFILRDRGKI